MKIATISRVCVIFVAIGCSGESRSTVPNMIGAKMAPRFNVRCHDGACGSRRDVLVRSARFSVDDALGIDLVALVVDPHVVVAVLLRAAASLLLRGHRVDYAGGLEAIFPPAITVRTTAPPR